MKTTIGENADNGEIRYEKVSKGMKTTIRENADLEETRYEKVSKGMKATIGENADNGEIRYKEISKGMKTTSRDAAELHLSTIPLPLPRSRRGLAARNLRFKGHQNVVKRLPYTLQACF